MPNDCPWLERPQPQPREIEPFPTGRVGGQQHLKAEVERESVDDIGTQPPADTVSRFEDLARDLPAMELHRAAQTGEPRSDNHDGWRSFDAQLNNRWTRGTLQRNR
jgi:hypothetical protein